MSHWPFHGLATLRDRLAQALARGRLHHAMLLTGPLGVGKRSIARWIARSLLCAEGPRAGGCGACGACHRVEENIHPDLHVIERPEGRSRLPVELVRNLIDELSHGALEGRGRVALVLDADEMNVEGQNSLLKTLEEPWPRTWLVLTSTRPEGLLPTVRSRVERLPVPPLPVATLAEVLVAEDGLDAARAARVAALAGGSLGRARTLVTEGFEASEARCRRLWEASPDGAGGWVRDVLAAVEDGDARRAKVERAQGTLDLCVLLLRNRGVAGDQAAWDDLDLVLDARRDLELGLGAELVLEDLFQRFASRRG